MKKPPTCIAEADARVRNAMGDKFETFRKLALMAMEQPATREYVEREMGRILDTMTAPERLELRRALVAAGVRK